MSLFTDEEEMQEAAQRLAGQLRRIETPPEQRAAFINGRYIPHAYSAIINQTLANFDPSHHYVVLSYTRLALTV